MAKHLFKNAFIHRQHNFSKNMPRKVAVVTGSSKGIGFAIVQGLSRQFDGSVYLISRDVERGKKTVEEITKEGLSTKFHQLNFTNMNSLKDFRDYIKNNYAGIDILVNSAVIAFINSAVTESVSVQAEETLFVNYFSLVSTYEIFPLLKDGARVVNVCYPAIDLSVITSEELREKLNDEVLTVSQLSELMQQYVDAAKAGTHAADWGTSSYLVSKVGVVALTRIQQRMLKGKK